MIYESEDGKVKIDTNPHYGGKPMMVTEFNDVMEARGCPIRADNESNVICSMVAAWDWLACKLESFERNRLIKIECEFEVKPSHVTAEEIAENIRQMLNKEKPL